MFEKPKQNRVYQDVVDQVQSAILDGRLKQGDTLPPGPEMQKMLGVSRGTLREALRVLEQKGLIEVRQGTGGGAVVKGASTAPVTETLAFLIRSQQVSLEDLARFRADVEGIVTASAAKLARKKDVARLNDLVSQAGDLCRQGLPAWNEFIRIDEKVHMALAEIAKNPLYRFILQTVHDNIHQYYDRYLPGSEPEMKENLQDLSAIVRAVSAGKPKKARELARDHVRRFTVYMQKRKRRSPEAAPAQRRGRHGTGKGA